MNSQQNMEGDWQLQLEKYEKHENDYDLVCGLCLQVFEDGRLCVHCKYLACKRCIGKWFDTQSNEKKRTTCPQCAKPLKKKNLLQIPKFECLERQVKNIEEGVQVNMDFAEIRQERLFSQLNANVLQMINENEEKVKELYTTLRANVEAKITNTIGRVNKNSKYIKEQVRNRLDQLNKNIKRAGCAHEKEIEKMLSLMKPPKPVIPKMEAKPTTPMMPSTSKSVNPNLVSQASYSGTSQTTFSRSSEASTSQGPSGSGTQREVRPSGSGTQWEIRPSVPVEDLMGRSVSEPKSTPRHLISPSSTESERTLPDRGAENPPTAVSETGGTEEQSLVTASTSFSVPSTSSGNQVSLNLANKRKRRISPIRYYSNTQKPRSESLEAEQNQEMGLENQIQWSTVTPAVNFQCNSDTSPLVDERRKAILDLVNSCLDNVKQMRDLNHLLQDLVCRRYSLD